MLSLKGQKNVIPVKQWWYLALKLLHCWKKIVRLVSSISNYHDIKLLNFQVECIRSGNGSVLLLADLCTVAKQLTSGRQLCICAICDVRMFCWGRKLLNVFFLLFLFCLILLISNIAWLVIEKAAFQLLAILQSHTEQPDFMITTLSLECIFTKYWVSDLQGLFACCCCF